MSSSIAPTTEVAPTEPEATEDSAAPSTGDSTEDAAPESGEDALGDPGKKALDAMKSKWKAAEAEAKRVAEEVAALKAAAEGREAAANIKIAKANLRAAATGKLADPVDALTFIDPSEFEVDDDGNTDDAALAAAIDNLITNKPYLAAQGGKRFQGDADAGARNGSTPAQLTRTDLERMSPEEINTARAEGRMNKLLGLN